jgi:hypothetical protein
VGARFSMQQGDVRSRLRLAFRRQPTLALVAPESPGPQPPEIEFVAYAEDCTLSGHLRLAAERLTDLLNDHDEVELTHVVVEDLVGGHAVEVDELVVERDELLLVHASGPRGNASRRVRTTPHRISAKADPTRSQATSTRCPVPTRSRACATVGR